MFGAAHLLKNYCIIFDTANIASERFVQKSQDMHLPVEEILPFDGNVNSIKLSTLLQSLASPDKKDKSKIQFSVKQLLPQFRESSQCGTKICVHGELINELFKRLKNKDVVLKVTVHSVQHCDRQPRCMIGDIATIGMSPRKLLEGNDIMFEEAPPTSLNNLIRSIFSEISELTVSIVVSADVTELVTEDNEISTPDIRQTALEGHLSFMESLLIKNFQTDTTIVAANGSQHQCHKLILTGNSSVFEAMFGNENYNEAKTKSVTFEDMSEEGVKAFLGYIYHLDVSAPLKDFDIAMELLEASEKYGIDRLKKSIVKILLHVNDIWADPEKALRLFCFVRNIDECDELKEEVIKMLKLFRKDLTNLEQFKLLFTKDPLAAMELSIELINA